MTKKTIREMSRQERMHRSLSARVFRSTLFANIILGVVALMVGFGLYAFTLSQQLISQSFDAAYSTSLSIGHAAAPEAVTEEVMGIYRSLSEEERSMVGTEAYRAYFAGLNQNDNYRTMRHILWTAVSSSNTDDIYVAMYDREHNCMVCIADPYDYPETAWEAGYWENVSKKDLDRFLTWDGEGQLYSMYHTEQDGWLCTSGYPLTGEDGEVYAFVLSDVTLDALIAWEKTFIFQFSVTVLVVTALITVIQTKRMKKGVVTPINAIAAAAQAYMKDKENNSLGELRFKNLNIKTGDEIENLSLAMADMERDLIEYIDNLTSVTAEKERIATELEMAANIQAHMLPSTFPAFPDRPEFDIYATMTPAKEVGGDFYDFFMVDADHLVMVMADVSGKGIPAALFMMTSRTMLKDAALSGLDPAEVLKRVNAQLCEHNPEYMFVTVWIGVLEISSGKLVWADAGHEQLVLYQNGEWSLIPKNSSIALAVLEPELLAMDPEPPFQNHELLLKPGDAIYQYTDGVTEAMKAEWEQFGYDRLLDAVRSSPSAKPEELLPHVRAKMDAFVKDAPQFDDITMLGLQYRGDLTF